MGYEVACSCGKVLPVSEGMAGSIIPCECGRNVHVPSLSKLHEAVTTGAILTAVADTQASDEKPLSKSDRIEEIIAPMQASLRIERGDQAGRLVKVMADLTTDAIWIQD